MKRKKPRDPRWNAIDITIGGEGVDPRSVPIRAVAELLQAAAAAVEATAKAMGVEPPTMHLVEVRKGSAAYQLVSPSEQAGPVIVDLYDALKLRGKGSTPEVRHALRRLHGEASKLGSLKVRARPLRSGRARKEITVAAPVADPSGGLETCADVYGRVVGLHMQRDGRISIHLRLEEGRTEEFSADESLRDVASGLFNECVRARVVYVDDGESVEPQSIERLVPWSSVNNDFSVAAALFRKELQDEGIEIDSSEWLRELRHDD